jgi:hypothetical protein
MADTYTPIERRRSRTRPRSGDVLKSSWEETPPSSDDIGKLNSKQVTSSVTSIGAVSHQTGITENTMSDDCGGSIPLEVVIITDDTEENIPSIRGHIVKEDVERRLKKFETLIISYKNKLKSSEHLNNTLHKYLRQTQGYAENLLSERQELVDIINEMEKEDTRRVDQELLLKFIMASSLFLYLLGGSHKFLVATVVLQLIVTAVNVII